ncbi:MAG: DUF4317 domain-containing protein [Oscillospiraceae bacterium]|nr:DUF4317 domain-containing protein [Oscillospiraceae bacterium]
MNQKELGEIRRRIRPDHNNIQHLYGCYVNTNREIISSFEESMGLLSESEAELYLNLLKKTLSGALGKNLLDISFASRQVMDSEEHRLLTALRKSKLEDESLREAFYHCIIDNIDPGEDNYLILLACDTYDVPSHNDRDNSEEIYQYLLCCICPVKAGKQALGYTAEEKRFHSALKGQLVCPPETGFLFPAFDDRATNIYNALLYSKNINDDHRAFIDAVFRTPVPMPAGQQKESFEELLSDAMDNKCSFDVVQAVHEQLSERIALYKESKDPEPMTLSPDEMADIFENSGADEKQTEALRKSCEENFPQLSPTNLTNASQMKIETPEVKITVDPKFSYLVQAEVINGKKYIMISADSGVEINGIPVEIR